MARNKSLVQSRKFTVWLFEEPECGYSVEVPELPGCFTEGDRVEEALANAREAINVTLARTSRPRPARCGWRKSKYETGVRENFGHGSGEGGLGFGPEEG